MTQKKQDHFNAGDFSSRKLMELSSATVTAAVRLWIRNRLTPLYQSSPAGDITCANCVIAACSHREPPRPHHY